MKVEKAIRLASTSNNLSPQTRGNARASIKAAIQKVQQVGCVGPAAHEELKQLKWANLAHKKGRPLQLIPN